MYSSGILRNTSSSPCPNAPQNKARPARTARREKPHTMGSMTPPPPPLFPAPQAFSPRQRYFEKCQPTPCSRRQHRQAGPHKRIGFLARGNQGRYSSIVPGHWTYLYGVLAGSVKYNAGLRSRTFGSRNPALRISKGTMPAAYRRRPYCGYGCDFGYDDAPGPGCRDYPRHDLLRGGTPHSQPRRHLLQVPDRHSSHRRVHGSDYGPRCVRFHHDPTRRVPGGRYDRKKRRGYIPGLHLRLPARTISESPAR